MKLVSEARDLAQGKLAVAIPRRWRHVQAVAAKANRLGEMFDEDDAATLVAAAWLHDVGYAPDVVVSGLHALDGARWLKKSDFDARVTGLVAYHSCAVFEAEELGVVGELRAEFIDEASPVRDALWYSDMTTGPDGQDLTVRERLSEIRERYGPGHAVSRFWRKAEPTLLEAVRRTEARAEASGVQPI